MESRHRRWYQEQMLVDTDHAPGGVIVYYADGDEEIIHVNKYVIDLFECESADEFLDLVGGSFRGFVHGEDILAAEDSIWGQIEKHDNLDHINYRIKTKTGRLVNIEDFGRLVEIENERPVFQVFVIKAEQRGTVDWLTGLPSMARFHEIAGMGAASIRKRGDKPVAIALDFVGLKSFNTQYGRDEGDKLLCIFADMLRKHFGSEACSRFAEDHFYAFAPYEGIDEVIASLFDDFKYANEGRVLPIRAGSYVCDPEDDIIEVGFDRAKIACDLDRTTWQSHNMWFSDEMRAQAHLRIHVLAHVDQAIEQGWIRPYYQALVRSTTSRACGEEALARWIDPEYGELSPAQFIPVLEEAGLLHKVDMHMVDCVLADFATKFAADVPAVPVSVNISLRDLGKLDIVSEITHKADHAGIPHSLLRIEFTESAASDDPVFLEAQVRALHEAGFEVWIDDFGSGYSSLNKLQEYSFDFIKLDMDFIRDVQSAKAQEIITGVVQATKKLGVGTLAEGVETEEQALFLESVGCDVLQGYFFSRPLPLEQVIDRYKRGEGILRENPDESAYWDAVGAIDLLDPMTIINGQAVDGSPITEFPAGILECRDGEWYVLRVNTAFRDFLSQGALKGIQWNNLSITHAKRGVDEAFSGAAMRSINSGAWERVAGRREYGTGFQFYVKSITATLESEAFLSVAVPTMLGTALGSYGEVPVAYAVFRVVLDESRTKVVDTEYVHANELYCDWGGYDSDTLFGRSFLEVNEQGSEAWFPYCYRAAVLKEQVHDTMYSPEINHWLNFSIVPSPVEGCCVCAFMMADDEQREREEMLINRDTSDLIVSIANSFDMAKDYESGMNALLERISEIIHPKRLFVFERGGGTDWITFEWCADGVPSQIGASQKADADSFRIWDSIADDDPVIYLPDISALKPIDTGLYNKLESEGITHMLAAPLFDGSNIIGNLVAENYEFEKGIDVKRLLTVIAHFVSTRIVNQRLVAELERSGTHDALTGLLNRRGFDRAMNERMASSPGAPYVLALMDIDDFKTVNDLHGHDVGDAALRALASASKRILPNSAIIGRNGGDELVAFLMGEDVECADQAFDAFSHADLGCDHAGKHYRLSMSIGYAGYPAEAFSVNDAYSKADAALYAVKLAGKGCCRRYTPDVESQYRSQLGFTPRDIAENIPGAILVHRAGDNGEILFANDEAVSLFECDDLADFMRYTGGVFKNIVHPDDSVRVYNELTSQVSLADIGAKNYSNYRVVTKKGNVRHVANNGHLVEIEEVGKVFYVLLINRDERDVS